MSQLTEDELKHLSPEEREFYESVADEDDSVDENEEPDFDENDYLDPDDQAPPKEDADADAGDDGADGGEGDDDGADGDDGDDDGAEGEDGQEGEDDGADGEGKEGEDGDGHEGEGEAEGNDGAEGDDAGQEQQGPALDYELPGDWQQKMDNVQTQLTELEAEWDDGEIEADAYKEKRAALREQEKQLDRQYTKAELAADFRQQQAQNQWASDVRAFLKDYPQFQPTGDGPEDNDNPLYDAMDAQVVKIAKANPELSGRQVLKKALERFPENVRNPSAKSEEGEGKEEPGKPPSKQGKGKGKQRRQVPPTLRNVPASTTTETDDGGKFAHLDRLEGLELEKAMARMSDAERDAYMRS